MPAGLAGRVAEKVLFPGVVPCLEVVEKLVAEQVTPRPVAGQPVATGARIFAGIIWLIGLAAVVFLWQKDSSRFFKVPRSS